VDARRLVRRRRHSVVGEQVHKLGEQKGVALRSGVTGRAERLICAVAEAVAHERRRRLLAKRRRMDHPARRRGQHPVDQHVVGARLVRTQGDAHLRVDAVEPDEDVGEGAQRGLVGPVQVVDAEHQRRQRRHVGDEPVQPVQDGEARRLVLGLRLEGGRGEGRRAGQQRVALARGRGGEDGLEELTHDAEGQLALELAGARRQNPGAAGARLGGDGVHQPRLADAGHADDREHRRAGAIAQPGPQLAELRIAPDETRCGGHRHRRTKV
jgi:hypothetical protein